MISTTDLIKKIGPPNTKMLIGGEWAPAHSGRTYPVISPIDGAEIASMPEAGPEDVERTIEAARESSEKWAKTSALKRSEYLLTIANLIRDSADDLSKVITAENGKVLESSKGEVNRAIGILTACAEEGKRIYGTVYPSDASMNVPAETSFDGLVLSIREPYGVAVAIPPYSDPLSSTMYKLAPPLAAGNTVILKAPPQTPLTPIYIGWLAQKAHLPDGVFNIVSSSGPAPGEQLVRSPRTDCVTFTGSTETGLKIYEAAAKTNKKILLEMSGSDPMIVLEDADLGKAVADAIKARFHNAGQICAAAKRLLVHKSIVALFKERFVSEAQKIVVGNPYESTTAMGPLVDRKSVTRIHGYVETTIGQGARLLLGGKLLSSQAGFASGCYYPPTVLENVRGDMEAAKRELFGPVAPIIEIESDDEALDVANSSAFGLQAAVYTRDLKRALLIGRGLKCGGVMINEPPFVRWENIPFGGEKLSGLGRDCAQASIQELTRIKIINLGLK